MEKLSDLKRKRRKSSPKLNSQVIRHDDASQQAIYDTSK